MSIKKYDISLFLSPALCRAARGLLGWTQGELSEKAHLGRSTVADFERGTRLPTRNNLVAMVETLENGGMEFIPENGEGGAGVRFRVPGKSGP